MVLVLVRGAVTRCLTCATRGNYAVRWPMHTRVLPNGPYTSDVYVTVTQGSPDGVMPELAASASADTSCDTDRMTSVPR